MTQSNTPTSTPQSAASDFDEYITKLPTQYYVEQRVSIGGMGAIYKAENRFTKRQCAIKVMRPDLLGDAEKLLRFRLEAEAASKLAHPNICGVYDFGITDGNMPYLVIDWIDGITLTKKVERDGPLDIHEAENIFLQVLSALGHAHDKKVVHRDLKPDNIMLTRDHQSGKTIVHLVDFGIAKVLDDNTNLMESDGLTKTGTVVGTPMYMSPEQARGKEIDGRSDLYSLGCVMYFAFTGKPPFYGDSLVDVLYKHLYSDPPEIDPKYKVPHDHRFIVMKVLQKKPEDRYQTAAAMAADLMKRTTGATVEIKASQLPSQKKQKLKKAIAIACFIGGFAIMYAISMGLQGLMDKLAPEEENSAAKQSVAK